MAAVAGKVPEAQAGALAEKLVGAIQATTDSYQLRALGQGMAALAGRISADDQATLLFGSPEKPIDPS